MNKTFISQLQGGKYQVDSLIGSGGFGNTYLATQVALRRKVAVKEFFMKDYCERDKATSSVIIPTEGTKQLVDRYKLKFLKEAQMIASLKNEHIIQIYDIFEEISTHQCSGMMDLPGEAVKGDKYIEFYVDENGLKGIVKDVFFERFE